MTETQFNLWGDLYRFCFSYVKDSRGRPWKTIAWLEKRVPTNSFPTDKWLRVSCLTGIATYSEHETRPFCKETGRKLALARYLKNIKWCRSDRRVVWEAYHSRVIRKPRFTQPIRDTLNNPIFTCDERAEAQLWETAEALERIHREMEREWEYEMIPSAHPPLGRGPVNPPRG